MNIVLVIGERPEQALAVAQRLGMCGIEAMPCARDWKLAVRSLTSHNISVIVLHVDSSEVSKDFFGLLCDITAIPVIALGVGASTDQVIWYLDNGAADYIPRTTPDGILAAKALSLMRTAAGRADGEPLRIGDLTIDLDRREVKLAGQNISLTPIEFKLLGVLVQNAGRACARRTLLRLVWGEDFESCSHYLRLYIGYLRQKLEPDPQRPRVILTDWGFGYRLVEPQRAKPKTAPIRRAASG